MAMCLCAITCCLSSTILEEKIFYIDEICLNFIKFFEYVITAQFCVHSNNILISSAIITSYGPYKYLVLVEWCPSLCEYIVHTCILWWYGGAPSPHVSIQSIQVPCSGRVEPLPRAIQVPFVLEELCTSHKHIQICYNLYLSKLKTFNNFRTTIWTNLTKSTCIKITIIFAGFWPLRWYKMITPNYQTPGLYMTLQTSTMVFTECCTLHMVRDTFSFHWHLTITNRILNQWTFLKYYTLNIVDQNQAYIVIIKNIGTSV